MTKKPKDTRVYQVAMAYVAMKAQGHKLQAISDTLQIPKDTIKTYVARAHKAGWLEPRDLDVEDQQEVTLPELITRNVVEFLNARDKDVTVEAAKGIGIFKSHQAVKMEGQVGVGLALRVEVELPPGIAERSPIQIRGGSLGGTPAVDGEFVEADE
jgi:transposase